MRALLDVNVLIALLDATHSFHARAHVWWAAEAAEGWASCPLTENGVARIIARPAYSISRRFTVEEVVSALAQFAAGSDHEFWPDTLTVRNAAIFATERIHASRQLSDLYLLAMAAEHGGRLVTFDQGIPLSAVKTAAAGCLCVL